MTPPARSPPENAAVIDSAASLQARSGSRLRASEPVTISRTRWFGDSASSTARAGSASWPCSFSAYSRAGSSRSPTNTLNVSPVDLSATRNASSRRSNCRVVNGPSSTSGRPVRLPLCSPGVTCASRRALLCRVAGRPFVQPALRVTRGGPGWERHRRVPRVQRRARSDVRAHLFGRGQEPHRPELERPPGPVPLATPRTSRVHEAVDRHDDGGGYADEDEHRLHD